MHMTLPSNVPPDDPGFSRTGAFDDDGRSDRATVLLHAMVALIGLMAGFVLGCLYSQSSPAVPSAAQIAPVPHPRALGAGRTWTQ